MSQPPLSPEEEAARAAFDADPSVIAQMSCDAWAELVRHCPLPPSCADDPIAAAAVRITWQGGYRAAMSDCERMLGFAWGRKDPPRLNS